MAVLTETLTLDGSGEVTKTLTESFVGLLTVIIIDKDGGTNNPVCVFTEVSNLARTLLTATESGSTATSYPIRERVVDNTSAVLSVYNYYLIDSEIQVAITGGDNAGTVTIAIQYIPIQG